MCVWASTKPGNTVSLERSMTVAPVGIARLAPTALIRSPSISITWLVAVVAVSGSISRPALIAVIGGGVWAVVEMATNTRIEHRKIVLRRQRMFPPLVTSLRFFSLDSAKRLRLTFYTVNDRRAIFLFDFDSGR